MAEERIGTEPTEPAQSAEEKTSNVRYEPLEKSLPGFGVMARGGVAIPRRMVFEEGRLVDVTGKPMEGGHVERGGGALGRTTAEGFVNLPISQGEFERLSSKTREILAQA